MGRRVLTFLASLSALVSTVSAQITGGGGYGYGSEYSILGMISHLIGIEVHRPYAAIGVTATIGVMWVSTYIVFKIAVQFMDENTGDDYDDYFADSLGIANEDDKNILAVLTLLIVLTMLGTAGFAGVLNGWRTLILLAFLLAVLAALILILVGGTGAVAYGTGAGAKAAAEGVEELRDALDTVETMEKDIDNQEKDEKNRIEKGDKDSADEEAELTAEELEEIIEILNEVEEEIDDLLDNLEKDLEEELEKIREIADLLGEPDE